MVSARGVIPCGLGRPVAEKHRTGAGDAVYQVASVAGLNNEVFRTVLVRNSNTLLQIFRYDQAAGRQCLARRFGTGQVSKLAFNGLADARGHRGIRRQQNHLRIGAVFRL
ncbi:hypothetical protein D3C72_1489940 [compost metagenome]